MLGVVLDKKLEVINDYIDRSKKFKNYHISQRIRAKRFDCIFYFLNMGLLALQTVIAALTGFAVLDPVTAGIIIALVSAGIFLIGKGSDYYNFPVLGCEHNFLAMEFNELLSELEALLLDVKFASVNPEELEVKLKDKIAKFVSLENRSNQTHLRGVFCCM